MIIANIIWFLVHTITVKTGHILDSISVNGQRFGGEGGYDTITITPGPGQKVTSIQYKIAKNGYSYCNFIFHLTDGSLGPYAIDDNYAYCNTGSTLTTGTYNFGNGGIEFFEFMQQNSQLNVDGHLQFK